jgi:hypothetical protein
MVTLKETNVAVDTSLIHPAHGSYPPNKAKECLVTKIETSQFLCTFCPYVPSTHRDLEILSERVFNQRINRKNDAFMHGTFTTVAV